MLPRMRPARLPARRRPPGGRRRFVRGQAALGRDRAQCTDGGDNCKQGWRERGCAARAPQAPSAGRAHLHAEHGVDLPADLLHELLTPPPPHRTSACAALSMLWWPGGFPSTTCVSDMQRGCHNTMATSAVAQARTRCPAEQTHSPCRRCRRCAAPPCPAAASAPLSRPHNPRQLKGSSGKGTEVQAPAVRGLRTLECGHMNATRVAAHSLSTTAQLTLHMQKPSGSLATSRSASFCSPRDACQHAAGHLLKPGPRRTCLSTCLPTIPPACSFSLELTQPMVCDADA